jgi:tetratricopeptide (TPR) repeat protein
MVVPLMLKNRRLIVMYVEEASESIWQVPFDQLSGFVGRENEIQRLKQKLFEPSSRRVVAILGLGGVGKSRLALEIAFQTRTDQPERAILWIDATEKLTFEKDVLAIAKKLGIPGANDEKTDIKQIFKQGLSSWSPGKWLLIIDNADDEALWGQQLIPDSTLMNCLPNTRNGAILITTRTRRVAVTLAGKELVSLVELSAAVAARMFVGMLEDQDLAGDAVAVSTLLENLAFLPLAITQAAAFINMTQVPVQTYLKLLDQPEGHVIKLLSKDFGDPSRTQTAKNPVATTWFISFNHIRKNHSLAADFLSSMACFHEKNIPQSLLPKGESEVDFVEAIGVLIGYSFVRKHTTGGNSEEMYDLHRLVQIAARNWLTIEDSLSHWKRRCLNRTNRCFPLAKHGYKDIWTMYMPHAQRLCDDSEMADIPERYELLQKMGECFIKDGKYDEAVSAQKIVVQYAENTRRVTGSDLELFHAYKHLGTALTWTGEGVAAQDFTEKCLVIALEVLGPEHPDTLDVKIQLGKVYGNRGLFTRAEEHLETAMHTSLRVLGHDHAHTTASMSYLAEIYRGQKRFKEAEELLSRAVEGYKKVLGEEDPSTLESLSALAWLSYQQGRFEEAEKLQGYVLDTNARVLGPEHPETLRCTLRLVSVYAGQHRYEDAEVLGTQTMEKLKKVLGPLHPNTLVSMNNLAGILKQQGKIVEAIKLMSQCVQLKVQVEGAEHPNTRHSTATLARWQHDLEASKGS